MSSSGCPAARSRAKRKASRPCSRGKKSGPATRFGADLVQLELHRGDHPEVAATAAQSPEEIRVFAGAGGNQAPIGGHHIGREQVVAAQAVLAHEPTESTAEGEAGDPGGGDDAAGGGQAKDLRFPVELTPGDAAVDPGPAGGWVDPDAFHAGQVDRQTAIAERGAGDVVTTGAHRHGQIVVPGEGERVQHVRHTSTMGDEGRVAVDHRIPKRSRRVVSIVARNKHVAAQSCAQVRDRGFRKILAG